MIYNMGSTKRCSLALREIPYQSGEDWKEGAAAGLPVTQDKLGPR